MRSTDSAVSTEIRCDNVAVLRLDLPGSRVNLLTPKLWRDLQSVLRELKSRADLRGLLLASAKPGSFVAGADLKWLAQVPAPNDPEAEEFIRLGLTVLDELEQFPVPTAAVIEGPAVGGGLELALACDLRLASDQPQLRVGLPEVRLGLIPGWGGTQRLPRIIGLERACDWLITGNLVSANEAFDAKLINRLVLAGELFEVAVAEVLAYRPESIRGRKRAAIPLPERQAFRPAIPSSPPAIREAMLCLLRGAELPLNEAIAIETAAFLRLIGTDEARLRIQQFFAQKQQP